MMDYALNQTNMTNLIDIFKIIELISVVSNQVATKMMETKALVVHPYRRR